MESETRILTSRLTLQGSFCDNLYVSLIFKHVITYEIIVFNEEADTLYFDYNQQQPFRFYIRQCAAKYGVLECRRGISVLPCPS
jgi:hypothetical protein